MKTTINFFKSNSGRILLYSTILLALIIGAKYGFAPAIIYLISMFFICLTVKVYPTKGRLEFYNKNGVFKVFDIVYDRGSATRPNSPGILKYSKEEEKWFMVYDDGFEWPLSEFKNVEMFIYQLNK